MTLRLRQLLLALSVVAVLNVAAAPRLSARAPIVTIAANAPYSPTEVLVRFRPGASNNAIAQTLAAEGAQPHTNPLLAKLGYTLVTVPDGQVLAALTAFGQDPAVEKAEPNYLRTVAENGVADTIPTDPLWSTQSGPTHNGPEHIQALQVWDILTGTSSVVIAFIDTGVDLAHPDLVDKIWTNPDEMGLDGSNNDKRTNGLDDDGDGYIDDWRGWDFTSSVIGDNNPQDGYGHGTHVAGIAGAATNNGVGIAGVNWNAPLMVVRVLDSSGYGTDAEVAAGIVWATDRGAKIINLSLGGPGGSAALEAAVDYAYNQGVLVVAAAGNTGALGVIYPAAYAHALAIASTDSNDVRSTFSSYGPEVDLAAPGSSIYSTMMGNSYGLMSGTSMATPHVAGVAALLATLPQFNTPDKIRVALESTALDLGSTGWDQFYGYGLIQAYAAALFDPNNVTPTPTPTAPPPPMQYALNSSDNCATGVAYDWQSATGGINLNLSVDDGSAAIALPFPFAFNGQTKTSALVSTNGYLTFGSTGNAYTNAAIPNGTTPNDFIAPLWDDLDPGADGAVYSQTLGSAPNRRLVIEWNGVPRYTVNSTLTFQIVLHEGSHNIVFQYQTLTATNATYANGGQATVGIEFAGGTSGVQYSYNTAGSLHTGLAIQFTPDTAPAPDCNAAPTPTPVAVQYLPLIER